MWGGGGRAWVNVRRWLPEAVGGQQQRLFSEKLLAQFDGGDPEKPIYLAVSISLSLSLVVFVRVRACVCGGFAGAAGYSSCFTSCRVWCRVVSFRIQGWTD